MTLLMSEEEVEAAEAAMQVTKDSAQAAAQQSRWGGLLALRKGIVQRCERARRRVARYALSFWLSFAPIAAASPPAGSAFS